MILLTVFLSGCGNRIEQKLQSAKSLTIEYQEPADQKGRVITKSLPVNDGKDMRDLLSSIQISGVPDRAFAGYPAFCTVVFGYEEGKTLRAKFLQPDLLEIQEIGAVRLRPAFYKKICEVISKAEGRPFDPLQNNDPFNVSR